MNVETVIETVPNGDAAAAGHQNPNRKPAVIEFAKGDKVAAYNVIIGDKPYVTVQYESDDAFTHIPWERINAVQRLTE